MSSHNILVIKTIGEKIGVRARIDDDYIEHQIEVTSILALYKRNNNPVVENFLDLFESVIKRTINELIPHKNLHLKYTYITNEHSSNGYNLSVSVKSVKADNKQFKLDGSDFTILSIENDNESMGETVERTVEKDIETPDFVLKKYKEQYEKRQEDLKNKKPKRQYVGEEF